MSPKHPSEIDLQLRLDKDPTDQDVRLELAACLEAQNDPRSGGYRMMAESDRVPFELYWTRGAGRLERVDPPWFYFCLSRNPGLAQSIVLVYYEGRMPVPTVRVGQADVPIPLADLITVDRESLTKNPTAGYCGYCGTREELEDLVAIRWATLSPLDQNAIEVAMAVQAVG